MTTKETFANNRGVYLDKRFNRYQVIIDINGKCCNFGSFSNKIDAGHRYDEIVLKYRGEYAILNFPEAQFGN